MKRILVTTTINDGTGMERWYRQLDPETDVVIIVTDMKTPFGAISEHTKRHWQGVSLILPPHATDFATDDHIRVNTIQRRNVGLLAAIERQPDYVISVDDDNYPLYSNHVKMLDKAFSEPTGKVVQTTSEWWNPGSLCYPQVRHRGLPLDQRNAEHILTRDRFSEDPVGVVASLWVGDPDVDAIERACHDPQVEYITNNRGPDYGTWAPFNSQATAIRGTLLPAYMMLPGVGRYDDIWASYVMRVVMDALGQHVRYGTPIVKQDRNPHNITQDILDEMLGYNYTPKFIEALTYIRDRPIPTRSASQLIKHIYLCLMEMDKLTFITQHTRDAMKYWIQDLEELVCRGL